MRVQRKSHALAVVPNGCVESLCSSCHYLGCLECPERYQYSYDRESFEKKYPFVGVHYLSGVYLLVDECDNYEKRKAPKEKVKVRRNNFVWDMKTRSFKKAK